ncbi:Transmembrane domain-containing protein [Spironucleus salmonicida]|uniref:Transmembrane domain-containing protein n=1 Tax=Spironucleus salmonicida TaxID=348837 RepID=V6LMN6_9EUKA|nr:Transmembrane domain-containing protein [Spironucleus salmonicida]|eukprot:EST45478.1 Transmembrane domain-containing protein [Spironucleus salmonicida]
MSIFMIKLLGIIGALAIMIIVQIFIADALMTIFRLMRSSYTDEGTEILGTITEKAKIATYFFNFPLRYTGYAISTASGKTCFTNDKTQAGETQVYYHLDKFKLPRFKSKFSCSTTATIDQFDSKFYFKGLDFLLLSLAMLTVMITTAAIIFIIVKKVNRPRKQNIYMRENQLVQ